MTIDTNSEGTMAKEPVLVVDAPEESIAPSASQNGCNDSMEEDGLVSDHGEVDEELERGKEKPPPPQGKTASKGQVPLHEVVASGQERGRENPPSSRGRPDSQVSRHSLVPKGREDGRDNYSPTPMDTYCKGWTSYQEVTQRGQESSRDYRSLSPVD